MRSGLSGTIRWICGQTVSVACACAVVLSVAAGRVSAQQPSYEDELNNVLVTYQNLRRELISSQEAYRNLQQQYAAKMAEFENKLKQPLVEKNALEREVEFAAEKMRECQTHAVQIAQEREVLQEKYDALRSQAELLEGSSAECRARASSIEKENADLSASVARLQQEMRKTEEKCASFAAAAGLKEQSLEELVRVHEGESRSSRQQVASLQADKTQLQSRLENLEMRLREKTDLADSLNSVIAQKETALGGLKGAQEAARSCELDLVALREQKSALQRQVDGLTSERSRIAEELRVSQSQLKAKETECAAADKARVQQEYAVERCQERVTALRQENEILLSQIESLRVQARPAEDAYREAALARQQKEETSALLTAAAEAKDREISELKARHQDAISHAASLEIRLVRQEEEKDQLRRQSEECSVRLGKLELEKDALAAQIKVLRESGQGTGDELHRLRSEAQESAEAARTLRLSLGEKEKDIDRLIEDKRFLKEELVACSTQLAAARAESEALSERMSRQSVAGESDQLMLARQEAEYRARLETLQTQQRLLADERDAAHEELRAAERTLVELHRELAAKEDAVKELTVSLGARTQELSALEQELHSARRELAEYTRRKEQSEKDTLQDYAAREKVQAQVDRLSSTLEEKEAALVSLRQEKQRQETLLQDYIEQQTDVFARESAALQEQITDYQTQVVTLTEETRRLSALLAEREESLMELRNQVSLREGDNGELTRLWAELTERVRDLEGQYAAAGEKNASLQAELDEARRYVGQRETDLQSQLFEVQQRAVLLQDENERLSTDRTQLLVSIADKEQLLKDGERAKTAAVNELLDKISRQQRDNEALMRENVSLAAINSRLRETAGATGSESRDGR